MDRLFRAAFQFSTRRDTARLLIQRLLVLVLLCSLLGAQPARPVQAAPHCASVSLAPVADGWIWREGSNTLFPTWNFGADGSLFVDDNGPSERGALLRWDVSSIPANASVTAASLTLQIRDATDRAYPIYYLLRSWTEGSGNSYASGDGATWNTTNGSTTWGTPGASSTTDRDGVSMWSGTPVFTTLGSQTNPLTTTAVQGWVNGTLANHGLTIQVYNQYGSRDYLVFDSREGARPPLLNISYCLPTVELGDRVWDDSNDNGLQDPGETGRAGVPVALYRADHSLAASTTTNSAGLYAFQNILPGSYYLKFTPPIYYGFSRANQPTDPADELDSDVDPASGMTPTFTWPPAGGTASLTFDAGLRRSCRTVTSTIAASSDDAMQGASTMDLTEEMISYAGGTYYWGLRFTNIDIPRGYPIAHAAITFRVAFGHTNASTVTRIYGQADDNPLTFENIEYNISSRPRTTAFTVWNIPTVQLDTAIDTYPLTSVVQEIVNRPGWNEGNAMVFTGAPIPQTNARVAYAQDHSGEGNEAVLSITYCTLSPTSANISYFRANKAEGGIQLSWETVSEANTAGFNLYRKDQNGDYIQLNTELIPPQAPGQADGAAYTYLDASADPGQMYTYKLEDISTGLDTLSETTTDYYPYAIKLPMLRH